MLPALCFQRRGQDDWQGQKNPTKKTSPGRSLLGFLALHGLPDLLTVARQEVRPSRVCEEVLHELDADVHRARGKGDHRKGQQLGGCQARRQEAAPVEIWKVEEGLEELVDGAHVQRSQELHAKDVERHLHAAGRSRVWAGSGMGADNMWVWLANASNQQVDVYVHQRSTNATAMAVVREQVQECRAATSLCQIYNVNHHLNGIPVDRRISEQLHQGSCCMTLAMMHSWSHRQSRAPVGASLVATVPATRGQTTRPRLGSWPESPSCCRPWGQPP